MISENSAQTQRTLVFCDVDGTLSPMGARPLDLHYSGWRDWQVVKAAGMSVLVANGVIDGIRRIAELPGVEVRWLTDWAEDARELGRVLGLGPFEIAGGSADRDGFDYKSAVILRELRLSGAERFVWLDDNAPGHSRNLTVEQHALVETTLSSVDRAVAHAGRDRLIISPETAVGLTPEDLVAVEAFCRV